MSSESLCATLGHGGKSHATSVLDCHSNTDGRVAVALRPDSSIIWRGARSDCDSAEITGIPHVWLVAWTACQPDPGLRPNSRSSFVLTRGYLLSSLRDCIAFGTPASAATLQPRLNQFRAGFTGSRQLLPSHSGAFTFVTALAQDRYIGES